ncbi:MAG: beta-ketoacyl-ACP synthase [Cyanobacteria bacterium P01_A01_bin.45]
MSEVVVTGIGSVCALGNTLEESWQRLVAGKSKIRLCQPFPELPTLPLGMINTSPYQLADLTKLIVLSALEDAKLAPPLLDCAVVIGSSRSHQGIWEQIVQQMYNVNCLDPSRLLDSKIWLDTLPHMNAINAARIIGSVGIVLAPMAACATGIWSISQAVELIASGKCQRAIAGAVEAPITPLTITGFRQMGALAKTGVYPFDKNRQGLGLGEGGALFILESAKLAKERKAKIYGRILGFGLTADAYHPNQLHPEGKGAIAAIKQCLHRSKIIPKDIDYIHAHGTATQLNDRVESLVIQELFSDQVYVSSTKGGTGHTIGASGALGAAFSLMALKYQTLPPCVGLSNPEFDLNYVKKAYITRVQRVMCFSFGFGGQNAVIAMSV